MTNPDSMVEVKRGWYKIHGEIGFAETASGGHPYKVESIDGWWILVSQGPVDADGIPAGLSPPNVVL